jgi:DNA helicase-2/ATP-dependent DNA helicase PcrA
MFGQYSNPAPSRFLKELSEKNIEKISVFGGSNSYSKVESKDYSFKNITKQTKIDSNKLSKRVFHKKFGMGMVIRKDGDKLDIIFDKSGRKKIMEKFIKYM